MSARLDRAGAKAPVGAVVTQPQSVCLSPDDNIASQDEKHLIVMCGLLSEHMRQAKRADISSMQPADLVIDDAPSVRHRPVVLSSKGMIASTRGCKRVAHHLCVGVLGGQQLLLYVKRCKRSKCPTQRMPCNSPLSHDTGKP